MCMRFWSKPICDKLDATFDTTCLEGLTPPLLILANHASEKDVHLVSRALKAYTCNFIVAENFLARHRHILNAVGALTKRQFTPNIKLVKQIKSLCDKSAVVTLYPEGRLSCDGRTSHIPMSIAKLVKFLGVTTVAIKCQGGYLHYNKWCKINRTSKIKCEANIIAYAEELSNLDIDVIYDKIINSLSYDEYKYQQENKIKVDRPAYNIHTVLYKCLNCGSEFNMTSDDNLIKCNSCGKIYAMDSYGVISNGLDRLSFTEWYDKQKDSVRSQIQADKYCFEDDCLISQTINNKFASKVKGKVKHDIRGFTLFLNGDELHFNSNGMYSLSYEPNNCFYLSKDNVYKIIPINKAMQITKVALAVEEIFALNQANKVK